jgi:hypothetical protein
LFYYSCLLIIPIFKGLDEVCIAGATLDILSVIITLFVFVKISKGLAEIKKCKRLC